MMTKADHRPEAQFSLYLLRRDGEWLRDGGQKPTRRRLRILELRVYSRQADRVNLEFTNWLLGPEPELRYSLVEHPGDFAFSFVKARVLPGSWQVARHG